MGSDEAGQIIAVGLRSSLPEAEIMVIPVADGGEGTTDAVVRATGGTIETVEVTGPLGDTVTAHYGLLPDGVTAYRVGDYVFTYPGIDLADARPGLWVVVMSADPDAGIAGFAPGPVIVGRADGSVRAIARSRLSAALAGQNELRAEAGLPALPDPTLVTHDAPATGVP